MLLNRYLHSDKIKLPLIIWLFGVMSGFALMITGSTLNYWLAKEGIKVEIIGVFSMISLPYAINFLWTPIFDLLKLGILTKILGQRKSWICLLQFLLGISVYILSFIDFKTDVIIFGAVSILIAFFSSAQDSILGAIRTEIVSKDLQGSISGIYIFGYRIGMLLSGSLAIYYWDELGGSTIYKCFAFLVLLFPLLIICLVPNSIDESHNDQEKYERLLPFIKSIIFQICSFHKIGIILLFLILYRLPDNFISSMINPFFIHIGYNSHEIGTVGKFFGITSAIIGGLIASKIMIKMSIKKSLLMFGILHAVAHFMFIIQDIYGKSISLLFMVVGFESITGGMAMSAYIGFIGSLCRGKFRATQYALFSSMMGLSRSIFPTISGYIVSNYQWKIFFIFTIIATIPALFIIKKLSDSTLIKNEI
jgi:PAT family beta-lactamase induction signal transducer AmpG